MKFNLKNMPLWATTLMVILLGLALFALLSQSLPSNNDKVGQTVISFIEKTFGDDLEVELIGVSEESGVYKIKVRVNGQEVDSFASKDLKYFFPESYLMITEEGENRIMSQEEINPWVADFINNEFMEEGSEIEIVSVSEESGVYKLEVKIEEEFSVFATKDGKHLFPQGFDMTQEIETPEIKPVVLPTNIENFISCLEQEGVRIYGSKTCPYCQDLVMMFGGYELIDPIYVECPEEQELCAETKTGLVPEVQIKGELYEEERTLDNLAQATNCELIY
jgi:hypothetical protein